MALLRHYFLLNKIYLTFSRSQKHLKQAEPESAKKSHYKTVRTHQLLLHKRVTNKLMFELTNIGHLRYAGHVSVLTELWLIIIDVMDFDDEF